MSGKTGTIGTGQKVMDLLIKGVKIFEVGRIALQKRTINRGMEKAFDEVALEKLNAEREIQKQRGELMKAEDESSVKNILSKIASQRAKIKNCDATELLLKEEQEFLESEATEEMLEASKEQ